MYILYKDNLQLKHKRYEMAVVENVPEGKWVMNNTTKKVYKEQMNEQMKNKSKQVKCILFEIQ